MLVYTVGTFDLLHVGHLALLQKCRTFGDKLVVGVASDSVVRSYKPNMPVIPLDQRRQMLEALECVDAVRPYYELEYVSACKELKVDVFVIGEDWGTSAHNIDVEHYLKEEERDYSAFLRHTYFFHSDQTTSDPAKNQANVGWCALTKRRACNPPIDRNCFS